MVQKIYFFGQRELLNENRKKNLRKTTFKHLYKYSVCCRRLLQITYSLNITKHNTREECAKRAVDPISEM